MAFMTVSVMFYDFALTRILDRFIIYHSAFQSASMYVYFTCIRLIPCRGL